MKIVVGIATAGRAEIVAQAIAYLRRQTRLPDELIVCPASEEDCDPSSLASFPVASRIVRSARGLPAQRNAILKAADTADAIIFFDDDFLAEDHFVEAVEHRFTQDPDVVIVTGHVLADGAHGPGITVSEGVSLLQSIDYASEVRQVINTFGGYGCNMAIRLSPAREEGTLFDEALPLYAWWEDIDFSRRLAHKGRIVQDFALKGVHLGSKSGRTPGLRLGYSQVANIIYMAKKGSLPHSVALRQISKNVLANLAKVLVPEPWVDRKGRLMGNALAFSDLIRGKLHPQRILQLTNK